MLKVLLALFIALGLVAIGVTNYSIKLPNGYFLRREGHDTGYVWNHDRGAVLCSGIVGFAVCGDLVVGRVSAGVEDPISKDGKAVNGRFFLFDTRTEVVETGLTEPALHALLKQHGVSGCPEIKSPAWGDGRIPFHELFLALSRWLMRVPF